MLHIEGMPVPEGQLLSLDQFKHYDFPETARAIYLDYAREGVIPHETITLEVTRKEKASDLGGRLLHHDAVYTSKDLTNHASPIGHSPTGAYDAFVQEGFEHDGVRALEGD